MTRITQSPDAGSLRLRWLVIVMALMAALTAGWPLLNMAVPDRNAMAAGTRISVGTGPANSARLTMGPGWALAPSQSDPRYGYALDRGQVRLFVIHVTLTSGTNMGQLWTGLQDILAVSHPGLRLGKPGPVVSAHGSKGIAGTVADGSLSGNATIFSAPSRKFAIEMLLLAPRLTGHANLAAAQAVVRSVLFPAAPR
jgi:hypothetical protein